jgi:hypothetical protein
MSRQTFNLVNCPTFARSAFCQTCRSMCLTTGSSWKSDTRARMSDILPAAAAAVGVRQFCMT